MDEPDPTLDAATLRRLLRRLRPHRRAVAGGVALSLLGSVAGVLQPLAAREVIEALAAGRALLGVTVVLAAAVLAAVVANLLGQFVLERVGEAVVRDARRRLVARILAAPVTVVGERAGGDVVSRVVADTTLLRGALGESLAGVAGAALTLVGAVALMATIDPVLLLTTLVTLAVAGAVFTGLLPGIARDQTAAQAAVGAVGARLEPVVARLRTVKMAGEQAREQAAIDAANGDAYRHGVRAARRSAVVGAAGEGAMQVAFIVALGAGGARVASGAIGVGDLIAYLLYLMLLLTPVVALVMAVTGAQSAVAADARLRPMEALAPEADDPTPGSDGVPADVLVALRGATVAPGLRGADLSVPTGGVTALVGASGSGKTTLLELLCRLRPLESGTALVLGRRLQDWPLAQLRERIGYVEQDAPLVPGTLRENLRYGAPHATADAVERVVGDLGLRALADALPNGLDTPVGPGGRSLSGGERQRVAIARALLRRPELLLLDEASSQLDAGSEAAARRAIDAAARHASVVVVAHRLATVRDADRIVVLEHGRVRAVGTHERLCATDEVYAELARRQGLSPDAVSPSPTP